MSDAAVRVTVLGKPYHVVCLDGDAESLLAAAELLERTLENIKRDMSPPSAEALIAMGALHIAQDLLQCRRQSRPAPAERESAGADTDASAEPGGQAAVSRLHDKLDRALSSHS